MDIDYKLTGNELAFNFGNIYGKVQRQWFNQFRENIPSKDTMRKAIENNSAFLAFKSSNRINGINTSSLSFDVTLLENSENFIAYFDFTLNKNNI